MRCEGRPERGLGQPLTLRPWTATVRRRRLVFLGTLLPGVLLVAVAGPATRCPGMLLLGLLLTAAALVLRRTAEPRFLAAERLAAPNPPDPEIST